MHWNATGFRGGNRKEDRDVGSPRCSEGKQSCVRRDGGRPLGATSGDGGSEGRGVPAVPCFSDLTCVGYKNGHADNANPRVFGFVSGDPGINPIQRQVCSEDLSGSLIHDGIHCSILSSELASCVRKVATDPDPFIHPVSSIHPDERRQCYSLPPPCRVTKKNPTPVRHGIQNPIVAMGQGGSNIVSGGR